MKIWTTLIGVAILLYAVYVIYTGRIAGGDDNTARTYYVERSKNPLFFWFNVLLMLALAFVLIFNIFHF
ncbi:MAG TPA: hypothetical protein VLX61_14105 [Anaerolineales bacterium]|nr:hypothetical protein [Anaerolineales bacterium]